MTIELFFIVYISRTSRFNRAYRFYGQWIPVLRGSTTQRPMRADVHQIYSSLTSSFNTAYRFYGQWILVLRGGTTQRPLRADVHQISTPGFRYQCTSESSTHYCAVRSTAVTLLLLLRGGACVDSEDGGRKGKNGVLQAVSPACLSLSMHWHYGLRLGRFRI